MATIVFVDDKQDILDMLSGWFSQNNTDWQAHYLNSAAQAIEFIQTHTVDCVVTDLDMPDMIGMDLLTQIADDSPSTIRIAYSEQKSAELTLEFLHLTHRFIAKPANAMTLSSAIDGSLMLHERISCSGLRSTIAGITSLPVIPRIYDQLMKELASDEFSFTRISDLIESDIGISATILKVVNSPYLGLVQHVESITHATHLLGPEVIKNVLLSEMILNQIKQFSVSAAILADLSNQARIRSVLASRFARMAVLEKRAIDHCNIAGIMSSLGEMVLHSEILIVEDLDRADVSADLIGGSILDLWSLPHTVIEAVLHQRDEQAPMSPVSPKLILHAIRRLERAYAHQDKQKDTEFTAKTCLIDYGLSSELSQSWFDCFLDYQYELQRA